MMHTLIRTDMMNKCGHIVLFYLFMIISQSCLGCTGLFLHKSLTKSTCEAEFQLLQDQKVMAVDGDHAEDYEYLRQNPPKVPHLILTPEQIASKEIFIIGDVHGCYDELVLLIEKAGIKDNPNVLIILVGDLINKGPKNKQVIDFVRSINALSVRGNHDQKSLFTLGKLREDKEYPIQDKYKWLLDFDDNDFDFLYQLPYSISIPSLDALIVHAGLVPGYSLPEQDPWDLMKMRNVISGRNSSGECCFEAVEKHNIGVPWYDAWTGPERVYYGHDAKRGLTLSSYATGLDSGCVYGKELTGVFLTGSKEIVTVNASQIYSTPSG